MKLSTLEWHRIQVLSTDTRADITNRLEAIGIGAGKHASSTYIIRLSTTFIFDYGNERLSPVLYVGKGYIRTRLYRHLDWMNELSAFLPGASVEVKFCFPRAEDGSPADTQFEAYLLKKFKQKYGRFPLKNRISGLREESIEFSDAKVGQVLGRGTGYKYSWSIKPISSEISFVSNAKN